MIDEMKNFNPLAPRGARLAKDIRRIRYVIISIHSPLAGRDHAETQVRKVRSDFNPLAPRGARQQKVIKYFLLKPFLLHNTHPYRFKIGPIRRKMRYA